MLAKYFLLSSLITFVFCKSKLSEKEAEDVAFIPRLLKILEELTQSSSFNSNADCKCENGDCVVDPADGRMKCECWPQYGRYSETRCKACNCGKGANCTFYVGFFSTEVECICPEGTKKGRDNRCKDPCESNPCQNEGVCNVNYNGLKCDCLPSYTGKFCEIELTPFTPTTENDLNFSIDFRQSTYDPYTFSFDFNQTTIYPYNITLDFNQTTFIPRKFTFDFNETTVDPHNFTFDFNETIFDPYNFTFDFNETTVDRHNFTFDFNETTFDPYNFTFDFNETTVDHHNFTFDFNETTFDPYNFTFDFNRTTVNPYNFTFDFNQTTFVYYNFTFDFNQTTLIPRNFTFNFNQTTFDPHNFTFQFNQTTVDPYNFTFDFNQTTFNPYNFTIVTNRTTQNPYNFTSDLYRTTLSPNNFTFLFNETTSSRTTTTTGPYTSTTRKIPDVCTRRTCFHGSCEIYGNSYKCRCDEGYTGDYCEEPTTSLKNIELEMIVFFVLSSLVIIFSVSSICCMLFCRSRPRADYKEQRFC